MAVKRHREGTIHYTYDDTTGVYHAGSLAFRFDDVKKLYVARVELTDGGERKRKWAKAKTVTALLAKIADLQEIKAKGLDPDITTTKEWLEWWTTELAGTVKDKTAADYRWHLRHYVIPKIGNVPLRRLGPEHIAAVLRDMETKGLSPRTRSYTRAVLRRALGQAERWGKVDRNVAALVDAPRKSAAKLDDALDAAQAAAVLEAAVGDRLEALAVLAFATGIRQGEAFDLRWADVDLDAGTITIVKSKTTAGVRTIAIPDVAVVALKAHRALQAAEQLAAYAWIDPGLVFATSIGSRLDTRNIGRWWHALTDRAGVPPCRYYATRHTAATLMLNNGVPLEVVSATLGHGGLAITSDVYAKVRPGLQRTAADVMQRVLGGHPKSG